MSLFFVTRFFKNCLTSVKSYCKIKGYIFIKEVPIKQNYRYKAADFAGISAGEQTAREFPLVCAHTFRAMMHPSGIDADFVYVYCALIYGRYLFIKAFEERGLLFIKGTSL